MKTLRLLAVLTLIAALTGTTTKAKAGEFQDILSCDGGCGKYWFDAEYLFLKTSGSKLPPLVTGNPLGTPAAEAGVIGADSTEILSGNHAISDDSRSGYRFGGGARLTCNLGVEIDYFQLSDADYNSRYDASSGLIIGRPFINLSPPLGADPRWDTQLVNFPPFGTGYVRVSGSSKFDGYGARFKWNLFRDCCYAPALCGGSAATADVTADVKVVASKTAVTRHAVNRYLHARELLTSPSGIDTSTCKSMCGLTNNSLRPVMNSRSTIFLAPTTSSTDLRSAATGRADIVAFASMLSAVLPWA